MSGAGLPVDKVKVMFVGLQENETCFIEESKLFKPITLQLRLYFITVTFSYIIIIFFNIK